MSKPIFRKSGYLESNSKKQTNNDYLILSQIISWQMPHLTNSTIPFFDLQSSIVNPLGLDGPTPIFNLS